MPRVLHILTRPEDALAQRVIQSQQKDARSGEVEVVDLTSAKPHYGELLKKIFEADSVECW